MASNERHRKVNDGSASIVMSGWDSLSNSILTCAYLGSTLENKMDLVYSCSRYRYCALNCCRVYVLRMHRDNNCVFYPFMELHMETLLHLTQ